VLEARQENIKQGEKSDLIFRGQKAKYKLEPSLLRYNKKDKTMLENLENLMLTEFKRVSTPLIDIMPNDDFDWVVLAQHFGLPTRLLDWSYNPLAALWFAVSEFKSRSSDDSDEASVWILSPSLEDYQKQQNLNETIFDIKESIIYRPRNITSRIANQSSIFTLHILGKDKDLENDSNYRDKLNQRIIKPGCENDILEELNSMNINEGTIFPDLDGLCNHLKWRYFERQ